MWLLGQSCARSASLLNAKGGVWMPRDGTAPLASPPSLLLLSLAARAAFPLCSRCGSLVELINQPELLAPFIPSLFPPPSADSDGLPILSFQGTPEKKQKQKQTTRNKPENPPSALGSKYTFVAAALGPCGMQRGIWALIHERLPKGSWKRAARSRKSQAGWAAQHIAGDAHLHDSSEIVE